MKIRNFLAKTAVNDPFVKPHRDYGDLIFDKAHNETFHQKLKSIQRNPCLALSGELLEGRQGNIFTKNSS